MHDVRMFTVKKINRLKIIQDVIDRNLRPGQAAEMLGITPRYCNRLLKRYRQSGPLGLNNQSRGRTGNRQLPASLTTWPEDPSGFFIVSDKCCVT
ncbi:helix-turn-helix domain-containing protein [Klebsiella variicola]|uniref:helix-turn-helix domain-containing protein n=1 Tax=Klebsiella variicola TaxID=244366 RepID=UPI001F22D5EE|nr:helix-turn-helix domain-containing protein [Klebsiella variicola]